MPLRRKQKQIEIMVHLYPVIGETFRKKSKEVTTKSFTDGFCCHKIISRVVLCSDKFRNTTITVLLKNELFIAFISSYRFQCHKECSLT